MSGPSLRRMPVPRARPAVVPSLWWRPGRTGGEGGGSDCRGGLRPRIFTGSSHPSAHRSLPIAMYTFVLTLCFLLLWLGVVCDLLQHRTLIAGWTRGSSSPTKANELADRFAALVPDRVELSGSANVMQDAFVNLVDGLEAWVDQKQSTHSNPTYVRRHVRQLYA